MCVVVTGGRREVWNQKERCQTRGAQVSSFHAQGAADTWGEVGGTSLQLLSAVCVCPHFLSVSCGQNHA